MKHPLTLAQWLTAARPDNVPVAWQGEHVWTLGHLRHDVGQTIATLQQMEGQRWALCCENSYLFIVSLLATLHAGKTPVIPGHNRVSLLNEQSPLFDGILSDKALDWAGRQLIVSSAGCAISHHQAFTAIPRDACVELFTSGSTGQPKRVIKPVYCLDNEAALLATRFGERMAGCRLVASVVPQHLYGLTFRIFLPMALGLPLHTEMLWYSEQLAGLSPEHRYVFISSPAFLKRLDRQLPPPPVSLVLSAGGVLSWQDALQTADWLRVWPEEIYGSTETGVIAWRYRAADKVAWQALPGITFQPEEGFFRLFSPLIPSREGILLDDILQFTEPDRFYLAGRGGRVVKIEEKRVSLSEVEARLITLEGIREAAALVVSRGGRQSVGALLVLDDQARQRWSEGDRKVQERAWRRALVPWLEAVAIPRYWQVADEIPVNSMNKRIYAQLQELFDESA